ncbi:MAG: hypothetical protein KAS32_05630 [Candidatus Peribacteraceae bacterium]|nr:hypothetical protein [Candidatus Peribacteraceae bacterium]
MKKLLPIFVLLFTSFAVGAADNFTMWESQTFTGPFVDGVVATSGQYATTTGNNSVKVHVFFEEVVHGGSVPNVCDCEIRAVIEEEIADNIWIPVATQYSEHRILDKGQQRVLILSPSGNNYEGSDENMVLPNGTVMKVSRTRGVAPDTFRVRVIVREYVAGALQSLTISVHGRQFAG